MTPTLTTAVPSARRRQASQASQASQAVGTLAALGAGVLLALMIAQNGALARATDPWLASWLVHGVGALVAALLWVGAIRLGAARARSANAVYASPVANPAPAAAEAVPHWAWLGGLPGALTVVLAAFCLNSPLGMAGTLALLLLGQLLFGALCDALGWFGLPRRQPQGVDWLAILLVMAGALLIVLR